MRVFVDAIGDHPLGRVMVDLATSSARHDLAPSPDEADLVLLCGSFTADPRQLVDHPLYRRAPGRCAVYTGDDRYCALVPGVYTSARRGLSTRLGRARSQAYASSYGLHANDAVRAAQSGPLEPRPSPRYLGSFEGSVTSRLRRQMLALAVDPEELVIRDTSGEYRHFDHGAPARAEGQTRYVETMRASRFVLCPRGVGTGTLRLFEAMSLGVAPVLISDRYVLPRGPSWTSFLVRVRERHIRDLVAVLRDVEAESEERGRAARAAWDEWFSPSVVFDRIVDAAWAARSSSRPVEPFFRGLRPLLLLPLRVRGMGARRLVTWRRVRRHPLRAP